jgi:hypothetical protein
LHLVQARQQAPLVRSGRKVMRLLARWIED